MKKYKLCYTTQFKRQMRLCRRRGLNVQLVFNAIDILMTQGKLPQSYRPHTLGGNRKGQWECHIQPDWLLIWEQNDKELTLLMINTGTHSDIFDK